jgi:hypothetical protein
MTALDLLRRRASEYVTRRSQRRSTCTSGVGEAANERTPGLAWRRSMERRRWPALLPPDVPRSLGAPDDLGPDRLAAVWTGIVGARAEAKLEEGSPGHNVAVVWTRCPISHSYSPTPILR